MQPGTEALGRGGRTDAHRLRPEPSPGAAGTVATKYFQRGRSFDPLNFIAWQMLVGVLPLTLLVQVGAAAVT